MKNKTIWILFALIIALAAILRLWQIGNVPPSPDWDEVALGYDAYSLLATGKDEYGNFLPPVLRSFDDYKPALYAYLAIPTVYAFGLNVVAVRLPSVVAGIIATAAVFYLIRELFEKDKRRDYLALITSLLFAVSPWSIQFSRVGFEANLGLLLNILMVLFFFKGLKKPWMLSLSAIFAALSIYAYQSEKVFVPLLILALIFIYSKKVFSLHWKQLIVPVIVGIIVVAPMLLYISTDKGALTRLRGTSIFTYQTETLSNSIPKLENDRANNDYLGLLLDNRRVVYAKTVLGGYLSHFDLNWLFIKGDLPRHVAPNMGLLYLFELPFLFIGIYMLIFGKYERKTKLFVFAWFLIAPIPASITADVPHAVRTLNFLPTWQIFTAIGLLTVFVWLLSLKTKVFNLKIGFIIGAIIILFAGFNFAYYINQYFVQLNYYDSQDWQYGYKQAVQEAQKLGGKYDKIIVSDKWPMDKSYMFFLFYTKYPPEKFQEFWTSKSIDRIGHIAFDKFIFRPINWEKDKDLKNVLFIANDGEIPDNVNVKRIQNLNGTTAIKIIEK